MKFRTPFNHKTFPFDHEVNTEASKTVPDQTMSVREIAERYARGIPVTGSKLPVYHGEENDLPDLNRLDLSEREALREAARENVLKTREELQKQQAKKAAKKAAQNATNKDTSAAPPSGAQAPEQK